MKQLLIDTGALLAMLDANDKHHAPAASFARANVKAQFFLPETIFIETMVLVKSRLGADAAVMLGERLQSSPHFSIVNFTNEDRQLTWNIFSRYSDKELSYVDCSLFAVARRLKIFEVFAFDHHFKQMAELTLLPE